MNRTAIFAGIVALLGGAAYVRARNAQASQSSTQDYTVQDLGALPQSDSPNFVTQALEGILPQQLPAPDPGREAGNIAAFLMMIRSAEGTAKEGGYGALFGWPAAGRSFDPYGSSGHPHVFFTYKDNAGTVLKTSAAGAYQITYTTWATYQVPFRAWALVNSYDVSGFTPATQDAFAIFLLDLDGALAHVKAGRLGDALNVARRRWASLPGGVGDQPERSTQFVFDAYRSAGGSLA